MTQTAKPEQTYSELLNPLEFRYIWKVLRQLLPNISIVPYPNDYATSPRSLTGYLEINIPNTYLRKP